MCLRCTRLLKKHLIQDQKTGLFVCERCGYAVKALTEAEYAQGNYIWKLNPAWPVFSSFENLMHQILVTKTALLPSCNIIPGVPSLILTRAFDILCDENIDTEEQPPKPD